jgi:hypothetical protein
MNEHPTDPPAPMRALDKRLRNLKPDCVACGGSGFAPVKFATACGSFISNGKVPCDCGPAMQANYPNYPSPSAGSGSRCEQ